MVPGYLALALMTGALWLNMLLQLFGAARPWAAELALVTIAVAAAVKLGYWRFIDTTRHPSTPESATGLGDLGRVRHLEGPHTEENYLLREMGFRIARRHARKLRGIASVGGFVIPALLLAVCLLFAPGALTATAASAAAVLATVGTLIERWLFFAEARHVVTLYYGAARA